MAEWINVLRNNSSVNLTRLPLLCRNSRTVALVKLGLTASWLAGQLAGRRNADKFQILKSIVDQIFKLFAAFNSYSIIRAI